MENTIIDNLLAESSFDYVTRRLLDPSIHWYYLPVTASPDDLTNLSEYAGSFSHTIFNHESGPISPLWEPALHILLTALDQRGQRLKSVLRVRYGFNLRTPYPVQHSPHIDQGQEHRVGLYYPHTSSGETVVFKELAEYGSPDRPSSYTESARIKPLENRWFDFDGRHWHSSTTPTEHDTRMVLTFNYTVY